MVVCSPTRTRDIETDLAQELERLGAEVGGVLHEGLFFVLLLGSGRGRLDIAGWLESDVIAEDLEVGSRVAAGIIGGIVVVCHDTVPPGR